MYNVKSSVWHTHTLSEGASVLIVENVDTGDHNSPTLIMNYDQIKKMRELAEQLWE